MYLTALIALATVSEAGCEKDTDCKGDRLCIDEVCTDPAPAAEPAAPAASATVCFRRPAGASGWAVPLAVRQDSDPLEKFAVGQQDCFEVTAGSHEYGAYYWGKADKSSTRDAATVSVDLAPDDCRYFKVIMGFWGVLLKETESKRFEPSATCDRE